MYGFHHDRRRYFDIQVENTKSSVISFIEQHLSLPAGARVLEIGCGEGGVLKAFIDKGYTAAGIEIDQERVCNGTCWMRKEIADGRLTFIVEDIFRIDAARLEGKFELIILKDVIEHLPDKKKLFAFMKQLLVPGGAIFFGFPPWQMPFGGHQQMCRHPYLSRMPWLHLLPKPLYKQLLHSYKEPVADLMSVYDTRITIEGFERLVRRTEYRIIAQKHYLVAPIYEHKFGWKQREQPLMIRHFPYVRNLFTTAAYYLITPLKSDNIDQGNPCIAVTKS